MAFLEGVFVSYSAKGMTLGFKKASPNALSLCPLELY